MVGVPLHTHKGAQEDNGRKATFWMTPRATRGTIGPLKAHLHKPRGAKTGHSCGTMDILASPVHTHARQPVPAAGVGLQPQGLMCPGASKWMDGWDPAAAKQTVWAQLLEGPTLYIYIIDSYLWTSILLSQRGARWGHWCPFLCVVALNVWSAWPVMHIHAICVCSVCVCLLGMHLQPHYWLDLEPWSSTNLTSFRLLCVAWQIFLPQIL